MVLERCTNAVAMRFGVTGALHNIIIILKFYTELKKSMLYLSCKHVITYYYKILVQSTHPMKTFTTNSQLYNLQLHNYSVSILLMTFTCGALIFPLLMSVGQLYGTHYHDFKYCMKCYPGNPRISVREEVNSKIGLDTVVLLRT